MTSNFLMKSIRFAALAVVTLVPAMACTYSASAPVVGAGGGNVAVQVYTQPGCTWQVTSSADWLQIFSARSGSGSGTVYVYLPPDKGAARASYINFVVSMATGPAIGGRSATVSQVTVARSVVTQY